MDRDSAIEQAIVDALDALERGGEAALAEFVRGQGEFAADVERGVARLRRLGLAGSSSGAAGPTPFLPEPAEPRQLGEFRVLRRIAAGGMGVVYLAEQTSLRRHVALKVLRPELLRSESAHERFRREVETVAKLRHPGVVPILAVGEQDGARWYAMDLVDGVSLDAALEGLRGRDFATLGSEALRPARLGNAVASGASQFFVGPYWAGCARISLQVAQAMAYVHALGVVHRDLKPSNVMLTAHGQALLLDFGLAHVTTEARLTQADAPIGSPAYMAPEQLRGEPIDERADVYSLGVTLYELLTGDLPFDTSNRERLHAAILAGVVTPPRARNRAVPQELDVVVRVAMDRDRERRYPSMAAFAADLEAVLARRPIRARAPGPWLRLWRACQRRPAIATAMAAATVLALQFPLLLWRLEADANARLADANTQLEQAAVAQAAANAELRTQRGLAEADFRDAVAAIDEMLVRTSDTDLVAEPATEALRLAILQRAGVMYGRLRSRRSGDGGLALAEAGVRQQMGALHFAMGRAESAIDAYRQADAWLVGLAGDAAAHIRGVNGKLLGQAIESRGGYAEAEPVLAAAECELEGVVARDPQAIAVRRQLAEVRNSRAITAGNRGDQATRVALLERAFADKEALLLAAPDDAAGAISFAIGCANLASVRVAQRRQADAMALLREGIAALHAAPPPPKLGPSWRQRLATLHSEVGNLLQESGKPADAEREHGRALALRAELAFDHPAVAEHRHAHGATMSNLARTRGDQGDLVDAAAWYEDAAARLREALQLAPGRKRIAQHREHALVGRCDALLKLRRSDQLVAATEDLAAALVSHEAALTVVRLYLQAAKLRVAAGDAAGAAAMRLRAIAAIDAARGLGFRDAAHFTSERWGRFYDELRGLPEFDAALARFEAPR